MSDQLEQLKDFRNFLYIVWEHLGLPEPTPVQYDIAYWMQHGPRRSITEAFRGVGKSYITSAFAAWLLFWNPDLAIMVVSASKQRGDDFTSFTLRLIKDIPILRFLTPRAGSRESMVAFDVGPAQAKHSPSVKSVGITGQLTGGRADIIIADDVEVPTNSATQVQRDKLSEAVKEFDAVLKPDGIVKYLGTPQTEQSLYNKLPERGYKVRIWPAKYPDPSQVAIYGNRLAPWIEDHIHQDPEIAGRPTDPKRFNELDLAEREASYGRTGFALQFMLDTRLADAERYPLKLADLIVTDVNHTMAPGKIIWANDDRCAYNDLPAVGFQGDGFYAPISKSEDANDWIEYQGSIMAIDPSGRGKDETAYAVVKMCNGTLYLVDIGGFRGGYDEATLTALAQTAKRNSVNEVVIEDNFGDGMFTQLLQPYLREIYPVTTDEAKASNQMNKERRIIDTLEPVMNQHRLVVDKGVIQKDFKSTQDLPPEEGLNYQLFYQMTRIMHEKGALAHDDRLDALAHAVGYWVERMGQHQEEALKAHRDEVLDKELEKFMEHALGGQPKNSRNWTDSFNQLR